MKYPNTGAPIGQGALKYYDIEKREEKTILEAIDYYLLIRQGQKILVAKSGTYAVIKPEENQKFEKPLRIAEMQMMVDPEARMETDIQWMHGVLNGIIFMMQVCMVWTGKR